MQKLKNERRRGICGEMDNFIIFYMELNIKNKQLSEVLLQRLINNLRFNLEHKFCDYRNCLSNIVILENYKWQKSTFQKHEKYQSYFSELFLGQDSSVLTYNGFRCLNISSKKSQNIFFLNKG